MNQVSMCAMIGGTWRTKGEERTKSTSGVLAKEHLKVKSIIERSPITLKYER